LFTKPKSGDQYRWGDRTVEVDGALNAKSVSARDCATGEQLVVPIGELRAVGGTTLPVKRPGVVSQVEWDQAKLVRTLLEPYLNDSRIPRKVLNETARRCGKSARQIQRYLATLRGTPLTSALVPKTVGRKSNGRLLQPSVERIILHCIRKYYLRRERMSVNAVYDRVSGMCRRTQVPEPSYGAVLRRIHAGDSYETLAKRRGGKAARQQHEPRVGSLVVGGPLELIQIDHTRIDVHVVSADRFREWLGRPWLTVCIDVYSRCVLGFYLSIDAPSSLSLAVAMSHAILPKEQWLKQRGLDVPWPMHGRPKKILTDNAAEFSGTSAARGCEQLGILLEHRPVARPHWGGHVERLIGTLMGHVHCLPGTSFSSTKDREDYESTKRACMTLAELEAWLTYEICLNYHVSKHRGIGMAPQQKWDLGFPTTTSLKEVA
jgi:putative transposase